MENQEPGKCSRSRLNYATSQAKKRGLLKDFGAAKLRAFGMAMFRLRVSRLVKVFGKYHFALSSKLSFMLLPRLSAGMKGNLGLQSPRVLLSVKPLRVPHLAALYLPASTGRLGNGLVQVGSILTHAIQLHQRSVILQSDFPLLKQGLAKVDGLEVYVGDSKSDITPDEVQPLLSGSLLQADWFYSSHLLGNRDISAGLSATQSLLREELTADLAKAEDLVIHYRVGDIFGVSPHSAYGPPPHSFFELVAQHLSPSKIRVIAEDFSDELTVSLIDRLSQSAPVVAQPMGLFEDVRLIMAGRSLAISVGTFGLTIAGLSRNLHSLYQFDEAPLITIEKRKILTVRDYVGNYVRDIRRNNWTNSDGQRDLVVNYSIKNLSLAPN